MPSAVFSRLTGPLGALAILCMLCLLGVQPGLAKRRGQKTLRASESAVVGTVEWVAVNEGDTEITEPLQDGEQLVVSMVFTRVEFGP